MLPALLAAAAPSLFKGIAGFFQTNQDVKKRDTTPNAFKESLAMQRQAAGAMRLPGEGEAVNRIAQGTAAVNTGALRAGGSSSDVLASLAASDAQQKQALGELSTRGVAYNQQQQGLLRQGLAQQAAYQQRDQEAYDKEKAALQQGGLENIYGAVDGLSQVATYGLTKASGDTDSYGAGQSPTLNKAYDLPSSDYYRRRRSSPYGAVPAGLMG